VADFIAVEFGDRAAVGIDGQCRLASEVPLGTNVVGMIAGYLRQDMACLFQRRLGFPNGFDGGHVLVVATDLEGDNVRVVTMYLPDPEQWDEDRRFRRTAK